MLDSIGWAEIVVLALAALFIFGPERLPDVAKEAAGALQRVRRALAGARGQLAENLGEDVVLRDLDLRRYSPKALIREHLLEADDDPAVSDPTGASARVRWAPRADDQPGSRRQETSAE